MSGRGRRGRPRLLPRASNINNTIQMYNARHEDLWNHFNIPPIPLNINRTQYEREKRDRENRIGRVNLQNIQNIRALNTRITNMRNVNFNPINPFSSIDQYRNTQNRINSYEELGLDLRRRLNGNFNPSNIRNLLSHHLQPHAQLPNFPEIMRAHRGNYRTYRFDANQIFNVSLFLSSITLRLNELLSFLLQRWGRIRVIFVLNARYHRFEDDVNVPVDLDSRRAFQIGQQAEIMNTLRSLYRFMINSITTLQTRESGWAYQYTNYLNVTIMNMGGRIGNASKYIVSPEKIKNYLINPKNYDDDCCGLYALVMFLNKEKDAGKRENLRGLLSTYVEEIEEMVNKFNENGIETCVPLNKRIWQKIEKLVDNRPINIYGYEKEEQFIYFISPNRFNGKEPINLCVISDCDLNSYHYVAITKLSSFLRNGDAKHNAFEICPYCLMDVPILARENHVLISQRMKKHFQDCWILNGETKIILPPIENSLLTYKGKKYEHPVPFFISADFECNIVENVHVPCSFGYQFVSFIPQIKTQNVQLYRGIDAGIKFIESILKLGELIMNTVKEIDVLYDWRTFNSYLYQLQDECYLCGKIFDESGPFRTWKYRHFCKFTGRYIAAAHYPCIKRSYGSRFRIPVLFHNLSGYDSHIIFKSFKKEFVQQKVNIYAIHTNTQKIKTFNMNNLQFIDSLAILKGSLDNLTNYVNPDLLMNAFKEEFPNLRNDIFLMRRIAKKGVYPYEYMDSFDRFNETSLPPIEAFYSTLREKGISNDEYEEAKKLWQDLSMRNLGDWHDFYLRRDVLLLSIIWQNFRMIALENDGLDPTHFITNSSYTWINMMKTQRPYIQLLHQHQSDIFLMIERGIRGGISGVCGKRYSRSNLNADPITGLKTYIRYFDANSLYSYAMKQPLPLAYFKWCDDDVNTWNEERIRCINPLGSDDATGYIFEGDFEFPDDTHDYLNDYPPMVERVYFPRTKEHKLILSLKTKYNYVVHYRALQTYLKYGVKILKIHRVLKFQEQEWLAYYIEKNIENRKKAKEEGNLLADKYYKELNNSLYGKMLENKRNHMEFHIVTEENDFLRKTKNPRWKQSIYFNPDVVAIEFHRKNVLLNKPIFVGFAVLELSKALMYEFYYGVLKRKYGTNISLIYTDTDSLIVEIKTKDINEDMKEMTEHFDFSEYPRNHPLYSTNNASVVGKFKDEMKGKEIAEVVALRAKMYSIKLVEEENLNNQKTEETKRFKGMPKHIVNKLTHQMYLETLKKSNEIFITNNESKEEINEYKSENDEKIEEFYSIRSKNHELQTIHQKKKGLTHKDNKRIHLPCNENGEYLSYSYGHYKFRDADMQDDPIIEWLDFETNFQFAPEMESEDENEIQMEESDENENEERDEIFSQSTSSDLEQDDDGRTRINVESFFDLEAAEN